MPLSPEMRRCNRIYKEFEDIYREIDRWAGLSASAFGILYHLMDLGDGCLQRDICAEAFVSKQTVNSALRKLEAEDILYLEPAGAKNKNVCLTEAGKQLAERTAKRVLQAENEIFASWPQEDMQKYLELTECFLRSLQDKAKSF